MNLKTTFIALAAAVMLTFAGPAAADHRGPHEGESKYRMNFYACIDKDVAIEAANVWVNTTGFKELEAFIFSKSKERTPDGHPVCSSISGVSAPLALVGTFNRLSDNQLMYVLKVNLDRFSKPLYVFSLKPLHGPVEAEPKGRGV